MDQLNKTLNMACPKGRNRDPFDIILYQPVTAAPDSDGNDGCLIAENPVQASNIYG